jgi:SAM-dependent methyltransferase
MPPPPPAAYTPEDVDAMTDPELDALLPAPIRRVSRQYWTPVSVARRVAEVMIDLGVRRVLDVGSGPGKFAVVAGARAPGILFRGVDHRCHLVRAARFLASDVGVANATFVVADVTRAAWDDVDALYVFNSFAENSFAPEDQLDQTVALSPRRRILDVMRVVRRLASLPPRTVLATYYGLGGPIPGCFDRIHVEAAGTGWLQVWRRGNGLAGETYWLEDDDETRRMTDLEVAACAQRELESQRSELDEVEMRRG